MHKPCAGAAVMTAQWIDKFLRNAHTDECRVGEIASAGALMQRRALSQMAIAK